MSKDSIKFHGLPLEMSLSGPPGKLSLIMRGDCEDPSCYLGFGQVREIRLFLERIEPRLKKESLTLKFRELMNELGVDTMVALIQEWEDDK